MLSGLSNQLGDFITSVKAKGQADTTSTPPTEDTTSPTQENVKSRSGSTSTEGQGQGAAAAPTAVAGGIMNLRSSLPSWLGGGAKTETVEPVAVTPTTEVEADLHSSASSATGGADSDKERIQLDAELLKNSNATSTTTTTTTGANLDKAKNLGSQVFGGLFSTIKGAGQKIKETNLLNEFQKEQNLFLKAKSSLGSGSAACPWVGHVKEDALKEEILGLSGDRRNFVRSPPTGVSFEWNFEEMLPIAKAILKEDPNLEKMRYELVPKVVSEENFWRNYFYRVTLLDQSLKGSSDSATKKQDSIDTDEEDEELEKELNEELNMGFEVVKSTKQEEKELDSLLDLK